MINSLVQYYYYFLHERHYFECHEVMEDAWKSKSHFSKEDIEVGFILLATSQYHLRRNNYKGAHKCIVKSHRLFNKQPLAPYGLKEKEMQQLLDKLCNTTAYTPIELPLTHEMLLEINKSYPHFKINKHAQKSYIDYHKTRDRSEIIQLRDSLMYDKKPITNTPKQCKKSDKK